MCDAHEKHDSHMKKCIWLDRYTVFSLFVLPERIVIVDVQEADELEEDTKAR